MALFEAKHLGVLYHRSGEPFAPFSDVSFSLEGGCLYNLTGPSGAGKSTLLNACALMIPHTGGSVALDGASSDAMRPVEWRRQVSLVPQTASLIPGSVRDNLLFPWTLKVNEGRRKPTDEELEALMGLASLEGVSLDHGAAQLSGGQQARIALLRTFATRPRVLLLDEVEAALDEESAVAVSKLTRALLTKDTACLRIRHRADDGYAFGTFTLADGALAYLQNAPAPTNAPVIVHAETLQEIIASARKGADGIRQRASHGEGCSV